MADILPCMNSNSLLTTVLRNFQCALIGTDETQNVTRMLLLPEESGVLADDVHNVRRDNGLVVLAFFHFAQTKELLMQMSEQ